MILAKWGGSLLTNKAEGAAPRVRGPVLRRLAREWSRGLAAARQPGVLVHGAGSFGHPLAVRHGIGRRRLDASELAEVLPLLRSQVRDLQLRIVEALRDEGAPAVPVPAGLVAHAGPGGVRFDAGPFVALLDRGLHPVTGGDAIMDTRLGARILGGDELLWHLARALRPRRAVLATDVDGVVLGGHLMLELPKRAARAALRRVRPGRDATGGMKGKLGWAVRLQGLGVETWIIAGSRPGRLAQAMTGGRPVGTRLPPA